MAIIYISSTFKDLKEYRSKTIATLRKAGHAVKAMEDYVATGKYPPLKKCLDDVASCDYYIGIFAWRYGYIPIENNPQNKAITELEYRQACELDIPRFVFLLDDEAQWSPGYMDLRTGDGNAGQYIQTLRDELGQTKLATFFKFPDELSSLVMAAINKWEAEEPQRQNDQYADSEYIEEIVFDAQHVESLNTYLRLAQEMKNNRTLSAEQLVRFNRLKQKSKEVSELFDFIRQLGQQAQSLVLDVRARLDAEGQAIAREISQQGPSTIGSNRLEQHEKQAAIIGKFERELKRGEQIAQWLKSRQQEFVEDSIQASLRQGLNLSHHIENDEQLSKLRREVEQYLRRVAFALAIGRTNLLDDANGLNGFPKELYRHIFEYIKIRKVQKSSSLLQSQKDLLTFYLDHLMGHVFSEF